MRSRTAAAAVGLAAFAALAMSACTDVHDFRGRWHGARVGDAPELAVGIAATATATLTIDTLDTHGLAGHLSIDGLATDAAIASIPGAEADVLAGITYDGAPLRVYLAFVPTSDGGGDATAVIALFDRRIEARVLRGGAQPVYAIFPLASEAAP